MIILTVVLCCPSALIISSLKSIISKSFEPNELGKLFAFVSGAEAFSNLIGNVLFNFFYIHTVQIYAGLTFFLDATLFCILIFVLVISEYFKHATSKESTDSYTRDQQRIETATDNTALSMKDDYGSINSKIDN